MAKEIVVPARTISGTIEVPGDKSISHRYAVIAGLAEGRTEIERYSAAADCASTLACLARLGVQVEGGGAKAKAKANGNGRVAVTGTGLDGLQRSRRSLDAENSGTTMRMMAGVLAGQSFDTTLTGDGSLRRRPMRRVIAPLRLMGARIEAREGNLAPLEIHGTRLTGIHYKLPVASAQVKSAVLLAGLFANGETVVEEPVHTRDHTELALQAFGAEVRRAGNTVRVMGRPRLVAQRLLVPGDLSSAVFFLAAALVLPDSSIMAHDVGLNPTRAAVLDVFAEWGSPASIGNLRSEAGELIGDVTMHHGPLSGGVISGAAVAQLIDELPMLAALGPYTEKGVEIRDAAELRVKESDRIAVVAENLRRMGARVEERPDGLRVEGRSAGRLRGAEIDPHGDHRIAMAFAVAALGAEGPSRICDPGCAAVSFPGFFSVLERLVER